MQFEHPNQTDSSALWFCCCCISLFVLFFSLLSFVKRQCSTLLLFHHDLFVELLRLIEIVQLEMETEYAFTSFGDLVFKCGVSLKMRCLHTIYEPLNWSLMARIPNIRIQLTGILLILAILESNARHTHTHKHKPFYNAANIWTKQSPHRPYNNEMENERNEISEGFEHQPSIY